MNEREEHLAKLYTILLSGKNMNVTAQLCRRSATGNSYWKISIVSRKTCPDIASCEDELDVFDEAFCLEKIEAELERVLLYEGKIIVLLVAKIKVMLLIQKRLPCEQSIYCAEENILHIITLALLNIYSNYISEKDFK